MTRILLSGALVAVCGAGCIAPNFTNWREDPTDRERAAMVNRRAAFAESPYGPYGTPTGEELARVKAAELRARQDWQDAVGAWAGMQATDPAWARDPHARVPGQAQWLTAIESKVIATQPWERGAVIATILRTHWMRDRTNRAVMRFNLEEHERARRAAYGGYAIAGTPPPDSIAAEDGLPGLTSYERHAWRIHWGYAHHWWMRDARPTVVPGNAQVPTGPVTNSPEGRGTFLPALQGEGGAAQPKADAPVEPDAGAKKKAQPEKPAKKKPAKTKPAKKPDDF